MDKVENVATPLDAFTVLVPLKVPEEGLFAMATVMLAEDPVTRLSFASSTETLTPVGPLRVVAETASVGWALKTTFEAAPGTMLNAALVAAVKALAEAVSV